MIAKVVRTKTIRRQHSPAFREEALPEKVSIRQAARQLGLRDSQFYGWRSRARASRDQSDLEQSLAAENARLNRQLAEQLAIVKKAAVDSDALQMVLWRRGMPTGVVVHSDRGSQYYSSAHRRLIEQNDLRCSMRAKGNCYDNACAESFLHSLKVEAIYGKRFVTREEMRRTLFEHIEAGYNRTRRHSANGFISPEAFKARKVA